MTATIISSDVLHLLGVGSDGSDHYLRRGRHLRWFPHHVLGFPRRGFVLRRRPSPPWPWSKELIPLSASIADGTADDGAWIVGAEGFNPEGHRLRITSPAGRTVPTGGAVAPGAAGIVMETRKNDRPISSAWFAVQVEGPARGAATITATSWSRGPGDEESSLSHVSARLSELSQWWPQGPGAARRVLLIDGGQIDAVEVHASPGVRISGAAWITSARYAEAGGWDTVGRFLLPIDGDNVSYPAQAHAATVIEDRLRAGAAAAAPPWVALRWPPRARSDSDGQAAARARFAKHIPLLQAELSRVLAAELADGVPQGTVEPVDVPMSVEGGGTASFATPPIPLILAAALESPVAHLLGLAAHDTGVPAEIPYDYCITAWYPLTWLAVVAAPFLAQGSHDHPLLARRSDRPGLLVPPMPPDEPTPGAFARVASLATALLEAPIPAAVSPERVTAESTDGPATSPLGIDVKLTWHTAEPVHPSHGAVVAATQVRHDSSGRVPLARVDPLSGERVPTLSGLGPHTLLDRWLRVPGRTSWSLHQLDIWGRWSPPAQVEQNVVDETSPPAPTALRAEATGPGDDAAGTVSKLRVEFDWTAAHRAAAPDADTFVISVVAGDHPAAAAAALPGTRVEVGLDGSTSTGGLSVERHATPHGSTRYDVTMNHAPSQHRGHVWTSTAVVQSRRSIGLLSRPVSAPADAVDEARPNVPAGLPGIRLSSWPDPDGVGWFRLTWTPAPGERVQILRASGALLRAAAGEPRESGSVESYGEQLRRLAVDHPFAFSPDHARSYSAEVAVHGVAIPGSSRDLTVLVIIPTGPTGSRAHWPTNSDMFTVVAARRRSTLSPPRVTAATNSLGGVVLTAHVPAGGERLRVWRSTKTHLAEDVRRMRPLAPVDIDESSVVILDDTVSPGRWYTYRAAVEMPDGRRSIPTAPIWIRTLDV